MEKKPFLTEAMAQEIIQDVPTPFHVYDEKGIRENARRINKAFSWNKGFKEYFAVKALPNPVILQILQEEGCGVDCSSLTELMLSEVCGFTGSDIMFSSNQTPVEDMQKAYELGAYINLDDATMVDFLDRVAGVPETVFCRYNPGGTFSLGESEEGFQVMDKPGDAKYGMTEEQMIDSYKKLMRQGCQALRHPRLPRVQHHLGCLLPGAGRHPVPAGGAGARRPPACTSAYINLSGGVGIPYRPEQTENDIMAIGEGVRKKFEEILVPAGMGDVAIFTEMGRFTTGPYGALVATAIHEKHIYKEYIGLDACAANLMRPGHVRGISSHHRAGQGGRSLRPQVRRGGRPVREQRQVCHRPDAAQDRHRRRASTSTIPARTARPWATITTASCAAPKCCCARTALTASSAAPRPRVTTLQRWTSCP